MNRLFVISGAKTQRIGESVAYQFYTTPWGSTPTSLTVEVWDVTSSPEEDVTATVLLGSASADGDLVTCPNLYNLSENHRYRLDVYFDAGENTFAVPILVRAIR